MESYLALVVLQSQIISSLLNHLTLVLMKPKHPTNQAYQNQPRFGHLLRYLVHKRFDTIR